MSMSEEAKREQAQKSSYAFIPVYLPNKVHTRTSRIPVPATKANVYRPRLEWVVYAGEKECQVIS